MRTILIAIIAGALAGGVSSFLLLPIVMERRTELEFGGVKVPVEYSVDVYSKDELLVAIFMAALGAALIATCATALGFYRGKPKRKK